ncbi:MAG: DUF3343 domain-containing protein [Treponema sp.]|jgi:hypothetical protein|nr:DUF3343 domain-containing protein [Treponema sp.]
MNPAVELILTFRNIHEVMDAEKALLAADIPVRVMPLPDQLGTDCGMCLRLDPGDYGQARRVLRIPVSGVYTRQGAGKVYAPWQP